MTTQPYDIHPLRKSDLLAAAKLCAEAMRDNPIHIRVFGTVATLRQQRLQRFFPGMLNYLYRKGYLYGIFNDECLIGVLGMLPPGHCQPSMLDLLRLLPTLLTSNSLAGTARLVTWLSTWARIDPTTPHWHLGPLSVAPAWQGQGIGTQLIEFACSQGQEDNLYLETDKQSNVELYAKFGFSTLATLTTLDIPSWVMMRHAAQQDT